MNKDVIKQLLQFISEHRELLIALLKMLTECDKNDKAA